MKILFVDDLDSRYNIFWGTNPGHDIERAANYKEAVSKLRSNKYNVVYLDHDLEDFYTSDGWPRERTGMDIAHFIVNEKIDIPYVFCHSANPIGRGNMCSLLKSANYNAAEFPFSWGYAVTDALKVHFGMTDEEMKKNLIRMQFDDLSG